MHINEFAKIPQPAFGGATSFSFVLQGFSGGFIDPVTTANDPSANAFAYVNQHFFGGSGTTSVKVTIDGNGNTVVTYTGSHPILPSYSFDYGFRTNGAPHFGFSGIEGSTILQTDWNLFDFGPVMLPTLSVINPQLAGPDVVWATLFANVTCPANGTTEGQWVEDRYTAGIDPTWILTNPTSCAETLSDVGYFLSAAEIPLDDLNFGSNLPPLTPFPALEGLILPPGSSITLEAKSPNLPAGLSLPRALEVCSRFGVYEVEAA